jgi:hypothetical protein
MKLECEFVQPDVRPVTDQAYRLQTNYCYCWVKNGVQNRILVPPGFTYDGASVPRIAWTVSGILPDGLIRAAALVHDWIYGFAGRLPEGSHQYKTDDTEWSNVVGRWKRREADRLFGRMMREAEVPRSKRRLAYLAVRAFGWFAWNT